MTLIDEFAALVDALEADGIPYAVCGGIAVSIHGYMRFTRDIDLLVQPADLKRVLGSVARCGFTLEGGTLVFGAGTPSERSLFRVSKVVHDELLTLDLLIVNPGLAGVWENRIRVDWRGRRLSVVSRAGLIEMKRSARRPQDLLDIEKLSEPRDRSEDG